MQDTFARARTRLSARDDRVSRVQRTGCLEKDIFQAVETCRKVFINLFSAYIILKCDTKYQLFI